MPGNPARAGGAAARSDQTDRVRRIWDKRAPTYDRSMGFFEKLLFGDERTWVCSRASGDVLEVAAGTGRNFALYPAGTRLTAIELSPRMLEIARARARAVGRAVDLREGDAEALPFPDEAFDTVVCTLSLCNIPHDRKAVAEMKRVLRPGGRLLLLDHVPASVGAVRVLQGLLEQLTLRLEGEHLLRRPLVHVVAQGFEIERVERLKLGIVERVSARKPARFRARLGRGGERMVTTNQSATEAADRSRLAYLLLPSALVLPVVVRSALRPHVAANRRRYARIAPLYDLLDRALEPHY